VDIFKHCQKNKKIKRADQILPEVYGTTLKFGLYIGIHFILCLLHFIP
jgi:hypothetical protein